MATRQGSRSQNRSGPPSERSGSSSSRSRKIARAFLSEEEEDSDEQENFVKSNRYDNIVRNYRAEDDNDNGSVGSRSSVNSSGSRWEELHEKHMSRAVVDQSINLMDVEANSYSREEEIRHLAGSAAAFGTVTSFGPSAKPNMITAWRKTTNQKKMKKKSAFPPHPHQHQHQRRGDAEANRSLFGGLMVMVVVTLVCSVLWDSVKDALWGNRNGDKGEPTAESNPMASSSTGALLINPARDAPPPPVNLVSATQSSSTPEPTSVGETSACPTTEPTSSTEEPTATPTTDRPTPFPSGPPIIPLHPQSPEAQSESLLHGILAKHSHRIEIHAPHAQKAIRWMTRYSGHVFPDDHGAAADSNQAIQQEKTLVQRYSLAALFFATHPGVGVDQASGETKLQEEEESAKEEEEDNQRKLSSTNERLMLLTAPPESKSAWMSNAHVCEWKGIECDTDIRFDKDTTPSPLIHQPILLLDLSDSKLKGSLPNQFALLLEQENSLLQLDLSDNGLTGTLPPFEVVLGKNDNINNFEGEDEDSNDEDTGPQMEFLKLQNNRFTGTLPASYLAPQGLYQVDLSKNQFKGSLPLSAPLKHLRRLVANDNRFSGTLPEALYAMSNLNDLRLHNNRLGSSSLDEKLGLLTRLTVLTLSNNKLGGTIPNIWEGMTKLSQLDLHQNGFEGSIPESIAQLPRLETILLSQNQLTGRIPDHWLAGSNLKTLVLDKNQFTGSIPPSIGELRYLTDLWLNGNKLEGTIPSEIAELQLLRKAFMNDNNLSGPFPSDHISKLRHLETMDFSSNRLTGTISPEVCNMKHLYNLRFLRVDCDSAIECDCCDKCY